MFKKIKQDKLFPFLFDVSNIKKCQDSYTNYLKRNHAKQFKCIQQSSLPSVLLLYTIVWSTENWMALAWLEIFTCSQTKPNHRTCRIVLSHLQVNLQTSYLHFRRHMGQKFSCAILSNYSTESTRVPTL